MKLKKRMQEGRGITGKVWVDGLWNGFLKENLMNIFDFWRNCFKI